MDEDLKKLTKNELIEKILLLQKETESKHINIKNETHNDNIISADEKLNIYMNLFKGREDIYAKKYTSKTTGKTGYTPVCKNAFVKYKCEIPKIKCSDCPYRELLPLTKEVIAKHLKGKETIGIYPLLPGDLCNFLLLFTAYFFL